MSMTCRDWSRQNTAQIVAAAEKQERFEEKRKRLTKRAEKMFSFVELLLSTFTSFENEEEVKSLLSRWDEHKYNKEIGCAQIQLEHVLSEEEWKTWKEVAGRAGF